ncbi:MAG: 16S rRNA (guanine(527)-N(7))-methyltransferase RsmG [Bifidobacteriaceae bacterium]|nr:16S rRNA (guanine(527)-N(7))-methyltransferase RsmG [Bifidobacteriaceae bacterium]
MKDELDGSPLLRDVLGEALPKMEMFHGKLQEEGELRGLIGPRELPRLWERHILNSAALAPFIEKLLSDSKASTYSVADIGSGAGFPGIVLAAMFPSVSFSLIETMERRVEWLDEVVKDLALDNVTVIRARAEEVIGARYFDAVTCRAVAPMTKLSHWMLPLLKSGGTFVALKGRSAQTEIDKAAKEIRKEHGVSPQVHEAPVGEGLESTYVVTIRKR